MKTQKDSTFNKQLEVIKGKLLGAEPGKGEKGWGEEGRGVSMNKAKECSGIKYSLTETSTEATPQGKTGLSFQRVKKDDKQ